MSPSSTSIHSSTSAWVMTRVSCPGPRHGGHARQQTAATHRHPQSVDVGLRLQHLKRHSALPGHDICVIKGVDEYQALVRSHLHRSLVGFVEGLSVQQHFGSEPECALHLHGRGEFRHDDHRAQPQALRMVGQPLSVVAGRSCDHALDWLAGCQQAHQLVERPALLEGGGELQVLELQEDACAEDLAQGAAFQARGGQHMTRQAGRSSLHILQGEGKLIHRMMVPAVAEGDCAGASSTARSGTVRSSQSALEIRSFLLPVPVLAGERPAESPATGPSPRA